MYKLVDKFRRDLEVACNRAKRLHKGKRKNNTGN